MAISSTNGLYKTGENAPQSGNYAFVRYTDGTVTPNPTMNERNIRLRRGEKFPPVNSSNKAAWWRLEKSVG